MKKVAYLAAYAFIAITGFLTFMALLAVWDFVGSDVIWRSFMTMGLLLIVSLVVNVATRDSKTTDVGTGDHIIVDGTEEIDHVSYFKIIHSIAVKVLVAVAVVFAFIGILFIWELIINEEFAGKIMTSSAIVGFASLLSGAIARAQIPRVIPTTK